MNERTLHHKNAAENGLARKLGQMGICIFLLGIVSGCQGWPGSLQANKFQADSERLLTEFQAEKKRANDLAAKNQILEQRLAETEKEFARQNLANNRARGGKSASNDSRLSIGGSQSGGLGSLANGETSRATSSRFPRIQGGGLPDAKPGTRGKFSSTGLSIGDYDSTSGGSDRSSANQWRPIQK